LREFLEQALADDQTPFATTALRIMASEFERGLQAAARPLGLAAISSPTANGRLLPCARPLTGQAEW
jgi:hypothetical protein